MTITTHRIALALGTLIGLVVGVWAYVLPTEFYDSFPGLLGDWIAMDGPFNEHLIRDVGAFYLALGAGTAAGLVWRHPLVDRLLGLIWTVFGVLHFAYHAAHLPEMPLADAVGNVVTLGVSLLLGVVLLVPARGEAERGARR